MFLLYFVSQLFNLSKLSLILSKPLILMNGDTECKTIKTRAITENNEYAPFLRFVTRNKAKHEQFFLMTWKL